MPRRAIHAPYPFPSNRVRDSAGTPWGRRNSLEIYRHCLKISSISSVVSVDHGFHKHILSDDLAVLFHHEIEFGNERRIRAQFVDHEMLEASGAVDVLERLADHILDETAVLFFLQAKYNVVGHGFSFLTPWGKSSFINGVYYCAPNHLNALLNPASSASDTVQA